MIFILKTLFIATVVVICYEIIIRRTMQVTGKMINELTSMSFMNMQDKESE